MCHSRLGLKLWSCGRYARGVEVWREESFGVAVVVVGEKMRRGKCGRGLGVMYVLGAVLG